MSDAQKVAEQKFAEYDTNSNGTLSFSEIKCIVKELGKPVTDEEVDNLLTQMDLNSNGNVTKAEFVAFWTKNFP